MNNKIKTIIWALIITLLFSVNFYMMEYKWQPNDSFQYIEYAKEFAKENRLSFAFDLNAKYEPIFAHRGVHLTNDNEIITTLQIGNVIYLSTLIKINENLLFIGQLLLSLILLISVLKISNLYLDENKAYLVLIIATFLSVFIFNNAIITNIIGSSAFFLMGLYYILKFQKEFELKYLVLFTFLASVAIWFRYPVVIFYLPVLIYVLIDLIKNNRIGITLKYLIPCFAIFFIILYPFIVFHEHFFSGLFGFIKPNVIRPFENAIRINNQNIIFFEDWKIFIKNVYEQVVIFLPTVSILFLLSFIRTIKRNRALLFFYFIVIFQLLFYFGGHWGGEDNLGIWTAYKRYFMPSFFILIFLSVKFLYDKKISKRLLVLIVTVFLSIHISILSKNMFYTKEVIEARMEFVNNFAINTEENAIFFTKINDKNFFPLRKPAIYQYFPFKERLKKTTEIINDLIDDQYSVYFFNEDRIKLIKNNHHFESYKQNFFENGLQVEEVISDKKYLSRLGIEEIYKITKNNY